MSFFPSNLTLAFFRIKKTVSSMRIELNTYGRIETSKLDLRSVITANEAMVSPMANDPVFPTKSLPWKLKKVSINHTIRGPIMRSWNSGEDKTINPVRTMAGHIVSKPFSPPSMFMVLVITMTIIGTIR